MGDISTVKAIKIKHKYNCEAHVKYEIMLKEKIKKRERYLVS